MKTVEQIRLSKEANKSALYLSLTRAIANVAATIEGGFMVGKIKEEIISYLRKCESADCEYTSYAAAHACEVWAAKIGITPENIA